MPDASPVKWHLAHTTWFFETFVLRPTSPATKSFDPSFSYLFNSYYNAVGDRLARPRRGLITRPDPRRGLCVSRGRRSRDGVVISSRPATRSTADVAAVIELGLNHEQQHQELILTDIKHALAQNPLRPAYRDGVAQPSPMRRRGRWTGRSIPAGSNGSATTGTGLPSTTKARATASICEAVPARLAAGDQRRIPRFHRGRRLSPGRSSGSPTAGTP